MPDPQPSSSGSDSSSSIWRRFARLTGLNIVANLTIPLTGLVDTGMLGHLDDIRFLAGVALGSVLFDYVYWTFGFLRMGSTGTTALALGRGDRRGAFLVLYQSLVLAVLLGSALLALQLPLRELGFLALAGEPAVEAAGREYFNARIWGAPATLCNFAFIGWYLGREESGNALVITVAGNIANIALNYLFIVRMGLAAYGAGLGTTLSQYGMLALAAGIFVLRTAPLSCSRVELFDRRRLGGLLRLNKDILLRTVCLVTTFAVFTNISSVLGTTVLAANTILLKLVTSASYLIDGVAFATESIAGQLRGRGDLAGLKTLLRTSVQTGLALGVLFLALLYSFSGPIYALITSHQNVIAIVERIDLWLTPVLLAGALAYVYDGLFLGLTEGRSLLRSMLASTLLVFAPLAALSLARGSNDLLWLSLFAFMVARTITLSVAARWMFRRFMSDPRAMSLSDS